MTVAPRFTTPVRSTNSAFVKPGDFSSIQPKTHDPYQEALDDLARQGYAVSGSGKNHTATKITPSAKYTWDSSEILKMAEGNRELLTDQIGRAIGTDMTNLQAENNRMFEALSGATASFQDTLDPAAKALETLAETQRGRLNDLAGSIMDQGNAGYDDAKDQVRKAEESSANAVAEAQRARDEYKDNSIANAALMSSGIQKEAQSRLRMIDAGVNPDGTKMSASQQAYMRNEVLTQSRNAAAQAVVPYVQQAEQFGAALTQQVSKAYESQANINIAGGGLLVQAGQVRSSLASLSASLTQYGENLVSAAQLASTNYQLEGRKDIYGMIRSNPYGIVSLAEGLSTMLAMKTIPFQQNFKAVTF